MNIERQYIGARYVPKFAEPLEWQANTAYEPLTIVTYNANSYTSKIPVPANINPTNSEYWANTGNYNQQIELYRENVISYSKSTPFTSAMIEGNKKVLICGDSVGKGTGGTKNIEYYLNEYYPNNQIETTAVGGAHFSTVNGGDTIYSNLIAGKENNYDYIIIVGGVNELGWQHQNAGVLTINSLFQPSFPSSNINNKESFIAFCDVIYKAITMCEKENIVYVPDPGTGGVNNTDECYIALLYTFSLLARQMGIKVADSTLLGGMWTYQQKYSPYLSDNVHPNNAGYKFLTNIIISALNGNSNYTNICNRIYTGNFSFNYDYSNMAEVANNANYTLAGLFNQKYSGKTIGYDVFNHIIQYYDIDCLRVGGSGIHARISRMNVRSGALQPDLIEWELDLRGGTGFIYDGDMKIRGSIVAYTEDLFNIPVSGVFLCDTKLTNLPNDVPIPSIISHNVIRQASYSYSVTYIYCMGSALFDYEVINNNGAMSIKKISKSNVV